MAHLVDALRYQPEGRGFDGKVSLTQSFRPHYIPGFDSASKNLEQGIRISLGIKRPVRRADNLITWDSLEIWDPQPRGILRTCPGL